MADNKWEERIIDYLDGTLNPEEEKHLLEHLQKEGIDIEVLKKTYQGLDKITYPEPGASMSAGFYKRLDSYKRRFWSIDNWRPRFSPNKVIPRLAYAMALLIIGWFIGISQETDTNQISALSQEIVQMKGMVALSLLNDPSPTARIKAVTYIGQMNRPDPSLIQALLETLNRDNNVNVRLIALDVLLDHRKNNNVVQGLIYSITEQKSPLVQLALADVMFILKDKNAIGPLNTILLNKELNFTVRQRIEKCLKILI